jgi:hypothetical protein
MVSTLTSLLERPAVRAAKAHKPRTLIGTELALFRVQGFLLAGWQLTPEQALTITGKMPDSESGQFRSPKRFARLDEDELADIPQSFEE